MPRYKYQCAACGQVQMLFHLMDEVATDCTHCEIKDELKKILTTPAFLKTKAEETVVGDLTKEYIEANREILKNQKVEAKEEEYEPS